MVILLKNFKDPDNCLGNTFVISFVYPYVKNIISSKNFKISYKVHSVSTASKVCRQPQVSQTLNTVTASYNINKQNAPLLNQYFNVYDSSTCFENEGSSSGRRLHVQVCYNLFTCQGHKQSTRVLIPF